MPPIGDLHLHDLIVFGSLSVSLGARPAAIAPRLPFAEPAAILEDGRTAGRLRNLTLADLATARAMMADPAISIADIAKRLEVHPSTLHRYFPGGRANRSTEEAADGGNRNPLGAIARYAAKTRTDNRCRHRKVRGLADKGGTAMWRGKIQLREAPAVSVSSKDEVLSFLNSELDVWSNISLALSEQPLGNIEVSIQVKAINEIIVVAESVQARNREPVDELYEKIKELFYKYPSSMTPIGQRIRGMIDDNPRMAGTLYVLDKPHWDPSYHLLAQKHTAGQNRPRYGISINDVLEANRILSESNDNSHKAKAMADDFSTMYGNWDTKFNDLYETYTSQRSELSRQRARIIRFAAKMGRNYLQKRQRTLDDARTAIEYHDKRMEDSHRELINITSSYDEKLRVESAVTYWREKQSKNNEIANWGLWAGCVLVVAAIVITSAGIYSPPAAFMNSENGEFNTQAFVVIAPVVFMYIWLIRIAFRLYQRNRDLVDDAHLREVMTMAYLALVKEGPGVASPEERLVVLRSLFGEAPGISEDDNALPSILDTVLKRTQK